MKYNELMSQVLTISCKLKVSPSQAAKLDATLEAFGQALNWVNQNTPEKDRQRGQAAISLLLRDSSPVWLVQ
jgi:hypothetical protein